MKEPVKLKTGERLDEIGFGGLKLIQNPQAFCYGIDAVLLADMASFICRGRIVDLGTGTGVIPLILSRKTEVGEIWGVEIQSDSLDCARRSVALNGLSDRIRLLQADVKEVAQRLGKAGFDAVVSNPPYVAGGSGLTGVHAARTMARHETSAGLQDFVSAAGALLRPQGSFFLIHRPTRLVDIFAACRKVRLEPKVLRLVSPTVGQKPNLVLIHAVKEGRPELNVLPNLQVYEAPGVYTKEILAIYERETQPAGSRL